MKIEELLRRADFSQHAAAHKEELRKALLRKERERKQAYELTDMDLEYVIAASKAWIDPAEKEVMPPPPGRAQHTRRD